MTTAAYTGPSLRTATGRKFPLLAPTTSDIALPDIAHALGNLCRFTGHTKRFYTVAEHCILVALILREQGYNEEIQLLGLLHDAAEAYIGDLSSPLKHAMDSTKYLLSEGQYFEWVGGGSSFRKIEAGIVTAILAAYGLAGYTFSSGPVKDADIIAGITEARDLMVNYEDAYTHYGLNGHKPFGMHVDVAMTYAQFLYTRQTLEIDPTPAELYLAVFSSLVSSRIA